MPTNITKESNQILQKISNNEVEISDISPTLLKRKEFIFALNDSSHYPDEEIISLLPNLNEDFIDMITVLLVRPQLFQHLNDSVQHNRFFIIDCFRASCSIYTYLPESLKKDSNILYSALNSFIVKAIDLPIEIFENKDCAMVGVKFSPQIFFNFNDQMKNDKDVILEFIKSHNEGLLFISDIHKQDKKFLLDAIYHRGKNICHLPKELYDDKYFMMKALQFSNYLNSISYIGKTLEFDQDVLLEAIKNHGINALSKVHPTLLNNKSFILKCISHTTCLKILSHEFKSDRDIVLKSITCFPNSIEFATDSLKNDIEILTYYKQQAEIYSEKRNLNLNTPIYKDCCQRLIVLTEEKLLKSKMKNSLKPNSKFKF
jgi:hypothetical protein